MSASTASNTGSAARTAGGRRPHWCISAARPSVFIPTVLPPVLGPTRRRRGVRAGRGRSARRSRGRAADGGLDQPDVGGELDRTAAHPAGQRAAREHEIEVRQRLDGGDDVGSRDAHQRGQLGQDPLHLVALGHLQLADRVLGLDDRERLDEQRLPGSRRVVHDAGDGRAARGLHGRTGRPPRSVVKSSWRCAFSCAASWRRRSPARPRAWAISRRRVRSCGDARRAAGCRRAPRPPRSGPPASPARGRRSGHLGQQRRVVALVEQPPCIERGARGLGDRRQRVRLQHGAARRSHCRRADVVRAASRGPPPVSSSTASAVSGLPPAHHGGLDGRRQRLGQVAAAGEGRLVGEQARIALSSGPAGYARPRTESSCADSSC